MLDSIDPSDVAGNAWHSRADFDFDFEKPPPTTTTTTSIAVQQDI
jgi:hypothetical protein